MNAKNESLIALTVLRCLLLKVFVFYTGTL